MKSEFEIRPAEEFMMKFFTPEHLENLCILKAKDSNVELWVMLREDSCIFARISKYFVTQLSYFAIVNKDDFESYNELINKLKSDTLEKSLAEEVDDVISGLNDEKLQEFLS